MSHPEEDEEEVKVGRPRGRPNAYWAEREPDTFGGGYRGTRPAPHGGQVTVKPEDTAGSIDQCWCGLPYDHNWPGKSQGRSHPRKETAVSQPTVTSHIDRRILRAYHSDLQELILTAVNKYGVKYRVTNNSVILYAPDGESTLTINARNSDRKVKTARVWFVRHCVPPEEMAKLNQSAQTAPVTSDTIKQLAEVVNSEEHLPKLQEPAKPPRVIPEQPPVPPSPPPAPPEASDEGEWVKYLVHKGRPAEREHEFYLLNSKTGQVKCTACDPPVILGGPINTGGHSRTHHTDTSTLWGPEAKRKAVETHYANKSTARIKEVIAILQDVAGITPPLPVDDTALKAENAALKEQVTQLQSQVSDLQTQIADQEAKIALAREAFGL